MLGANQDLMVLGFLLLIGLIGAMGAAVSRSRDERLHAETGGRQASTTEAVGNRPTRSSGGRRHAPERGSAPGPTQPARFNPDAYASVSRRRLASIAKHPSDHVREQLVFYGQITEFDSASGVDGFLASGGATQRWPAPMRTGRRSSDRWRVVVRCTVGTGLTWQRGDWEDELRPASEQFAKLLEGDVFKAFVTVAGTKPQVAEGGSVLAVPSFLVDRITVYATAN